MFTQNWPHLKSPSALPPPEMRLNSLAGLTWMIELVKYGVVDQLHLNLLSLSALIVQTEKAHYSSEGGI